MLASVKVMRSYDYCHFEVSLSVDNAADLDAVDALRKQAAILVDEAVRQYKIAKAKESGRAGNEYEIKRLLDRIERLKAVPASDLSIEDAAFLRSSADRAFWKDFDDDDYYYSDPEREHHFSMLRKFKETTIKAG